MRIRLGIYFSQVAFVDSMFYDENNNILLKHTTSSWRDRAVRLFCFHGKVVQVNQNEYLSVEADELDREFLELINHVPAREHGFWRRVCEALEKGASRTEVLENIRAYAIARGLKNGNNSKR